MRHYQQESAPISRRRAITGGLGGLAYLLTTGCRTQQENREETWDELKSSPPTMGSGYLETTKELEVIERGTVYSYFDDTVVMGIPLKWRDPERVAAEAIPLLPQSYGVVPSSATNLVWFTIPSGNEYENVKEAVESGQHKDVETVRSIVTNMDIKVPQYRIQSYIVRVNASDTKRLNSALEALITDEDIEADISFDFANGLDTTRGASFGVAGIITRGVTEYAMSALFANLSEQGYVKDMSTPTLIAKHNTLAENQSTVKIPIPEQNVVSGAIQIINKFEPVSNYIKITPRAMVDGYIEMNVDAAVGEVIPSSEEIPRISTRNIITTADLQSGQWLVLGGLVDSRRRGSVANSPLVGDVLSSTENETSRSYIVYFIRAARIEVSQQRDSIYNPDEERLKEDIKSNLGVDELEQQP